MKNEQAYRRAETALWAEAGLAPTERMVALEPGGLMVRVQEIGEGPTVVFIHGAVNGGSSWVDLVKGLDGFRCILVDRPGCGLSAPLDPPPGTVGAVESYADGLIASVLDALELSSAHVIGTSYGGFFTLRGAAAHPDRVERIVLFSWSIGVPMEKVAPSMRIGNIRALSRLAPKMPMNRRTARLMLRQIGLKSAIDTAKFTDTQLDWYVALHRHTDTFANELASTPRVILPIRGLNPDLLFTDELLARVQAPTLMFWGADDPQGGADVAQAFAARLLHAELDVRAGAGHAPWIDEPDRAAAAVSRFLSA